MKCFSLAALFSIVSSVAFAWQYPLTPYVPGSYAGRSFFYDNDHLGEDIEATEGTAVRAIGPGTIKAYRPASGYGELVVVIEHDLGSDHTYKNAYEEDVTTRHILSIYGHLRDRAQRSDPQGTGLETGDQVTTGQIVGYINDDANNGDGAEHLHMGIRLSDAATAVADDPSAWFRGYEGATHFGEDFAAASEVLDDLINKYHCQYLNQWVNGADINEMTGPPGAEFTLRVQYKNVGTATWRNTGGPNGISYVELRSVTAFPSGQQTPSWLDPVGWVQGRERVVACSPSSIGPNANATFTFNARIPASATPGSNVPVYFRPFHGNTPMNDWGGLFWLVHVTASDACAGAGGPCPGRQIPNGCLPNPNQCCPNTASSLRTLPDATPEQWGRMGLPAGLQDEGTYSVGFEYRATTPTKVSVGFGSFDRARLPDVIGSVLPLTASTDEWRPFWSAPFKLTAQQIRDLPNLRLLAANLEGIEFRSVQVLRTDPR